MPIYNIKYIIDIIFTGRIEGDFKKKTKEFLAHLPNFNFKSHNLNNSSIKMAKETFILALRNVVLVNTFLIDTEVSFQRNHMAKLDI